MIKIGVLEDEKIYREQFREFLARYQQANPDFRYTVEMFDTGERLLFHPYQDFDILFLDIQLPDMLGIDAAREIRRRDENVCIVFVTNLSQYAIDGYTVNAYDYILKPLLYPAFEVKLKRILKVLSHKQERVLTLKTKQEVFRIDTGNLLYVESQGHHLYFYTEDRCFEAWGTLSKYEQELGAAYFCRCNACYLVNLRYVESVKGNTVLVRGRELTVSQTKRKSFMTQLAKYKGGVL